MKKALNMFLVVGGACMLNSCALALFSLTDDYSWDETKSTTRHHNQNSEDQQESKPKDSR